MTISAGWEGIGGEGEVLTRGRKILSKYLPVLFSINTILPNVQAPIPDPTYISISLNKKMRALMPCDPRVASYTHWLYFVPDERTNKTILGVGYSTVSCSRGWMDRMLDHDWFLQHMTWWLCPVLRWFQTHELWGEGHQSIFRQFFTREIPEYSVGIFWDFEFCGEEYLMMGWVGQGICQHLPQCGLLRLYILGSHFWFLILIFDFWFLIFDFWFLIFEFWFWFLASCLSLTSSAFISWDSLLINFLSSQQQYVL